MDEFKVGDIVKTIRQSYGVNFSEAVVLGRYSKYICVMAKTQYSYNDWWVDPNDIIKTNIDDGDIKTGYNLPLIGVLESVCLIDAIDRSAYISKNVFAEHPEVFLNECEYAFKPQWENCEEADVVFYRV